MEPQSSAGKKENRRLTRALLKYTPMSKPIRDEQELHVCFYRRLAAARGLGQERQLVEGQQS